jgi:hypothetical protein
MKSDRREERRGERRGEVILFVLYDNNIQEIATAIITDYSSMTMRTMMMITAVR